MIGRARLPLPIIDQLSGARRGWHDRENIGSGRTPSVRWLTSMEKARAAAPSQPPSKIGGYRQRAFAGGPSLALSGGRATAACVRAVDEQGGKGEDGGTKPTVVASRKKQISLTMEALGRTDPPPSQRECRQRLK